MVILSEVDEGLCICWLTYFLYESGLVPIIVQGNFLLSNLSFLGCHAIALNSGPTGGLFAGNYPSEVEVNSTSPSTSFAENAWRCTSTAQ